MKLILNKSLGFFGPFLVFSKIIIPKKYYTNFHIFSRKVNPGENLLRRKKYLNKNHCKK